MAIDFSDINKLIDKCRFCVMVDFEKEDDLYMLQEIIDEIYERKRNKSRRRTP